MVEQNKERKHLPLEEEQVLDFEVAKDMTVGEAVRKQEELQAGVTEEDGLLDRYIKQHRDEIESQKYDTKVALEPLVTEEMTEDQDLPLENHLEETLVFTEPALVEEVTDSEPNGEASVPEESLGEEGDDQVTPLSRGEEREENKKKVWFLLGLAGLFVGILATVFIWMNWANQEKQKTTNTTVSSSSSQQTSTSSTLSSEATAFADLYARFFTDSDMTKLKNSEFGNLAALKALLDKMDTSSTAYKEAKAKYDSLEKAIQAVEELNQQFDKPLIVDGVLDTTATAKSGANLAAVTTGLTAVDSLLASAVNFGRSQQESAATAASSTPPATSTPSSPAETAPSVSPTPAAPATGTGVNLQRQLSRVPYDQAKIDDASNEAWTFNPGILENIIAVSQQRGYISGNDYILEKVNIINGRGYYNLFRPDGTYLFSINCKTGYFVGNGSGYADDLDY